MVTTMSDAAFAKELGVAVDEYTAFCSAWRAQQDSAAAAAGGDDLRLSIPWLPEGFDIASHLVDDA